MAKVKICGVTNNEDALWVANLGADFVGLNFYPQSPRKVSPKKAKDIVSKLPPFITAVGIFVDEPIESIKKLAASVPLKVVQLHGQETPEICRELKRLGLKVIKAVRLSEPLNLDTLAPYADTVDYFLFDAFFADTAGGTGQVFDWTWIQPAAQLGKPWFLSGGLTPDNVGEAIQKTRAALVDVCSGVERLPTRKDYNAMKKFIQTAKTAR